VRRLWTGLHLRQWDAVVDFFSLQLVKQFSEIAIKAVQGLNVERCQRFGEGY
jgi:hypothetical protein